MWVHVRCMCLHGYFRLFRYYFYYNAYYAYLLNTYLLTEIYNKRDILEIPRANPSLTIATSEYSCNVFVYPDRMTCVMYECRILYCTHVMTFRSICGYIYY